MRSSPTLPPPKIWNVHEIHCCFDSFHLHPELTLHCILKLAKLLIFVWITDQVRLHSSFTYPVLISLFVRLRQWEVIMNTLGGYHEYTRGISW